MAFTARSAGLCLLAACAACGPGAASLVPTEPVALTKDVPVSGLSGPSDAEVPFLFEVPRGAGTLSFQLGAGTAADNDADLYVRFGEPPTAELFDCRSASVGLSDGCRIVAPSQGTWFVLVRGATTFTNAQLVATYSERPAADPARPAGADVSIHVALGLPDSSSTSVSTPDRFLSVKPEYAVSYNASRKVANWVSWELNGSYLGSVARSEDFRPDDTLPAELPQPSNDDYLGSGYDRGHLCPSADRTRTAAENSSTFYLSNIIPQAANNNRGPWGSFEIYQRQLVREGRQLFVMAGGVFDGAKPRVGSGVAVPSATFKVVVQLPATERTPAAVTPLTRVIALLIPNDDAVVGLDDDWRKYRVTVRELEVRTGLDFLSDVPAEVQDAVETRVDGL